MPCFFRHINNSFRLLVSLTFIIALFAKIAIAQEQKINLHPGDLIIAEGDSITYGLDETASGRQPTQINGAHFGRSISPYPETLAADLHNKIKIENRGYPGDRSIDGLSRWQKSSGGQLVLIMYGTNDCANFGNLPGGTVDTKTYEKTLALLVRRRQAQGAKVLILSPPPLKEVYPDHNLEIYRLKAAAIASETGAIFLNTPQILKGLPNPWIDGIHLSPEAYQAIALALARRIKIL